MFEVFRKNIKVLLKNQHMTYAQLSQKSGIAESTIKCFMCGASDSRRIAEKIADALNVTIAYRNQKYIIEDSEKLNGKE